MQKNNNIQPIKGMAKCYRLRIGDWRIVYEIFNKMLKAIAKALDVDVELIIG